MTEDIIKGRRYRWGKMDPRRQFHVVRRIAPVLAHLQDQGGGLDVQAVLGSLRDMADSDVDYVLDACLMVCERQHLETGHWARVMPGPKQLMFQDMDAGEMLELSLAVMGDSLSSFFDSAERRVNTQVPVGT